MTKFSPGDKNFNRRKIMAECCTLVRQQYLMTASLLELFHY